MISIGPKVFLASIVYSNRPKRQTKVDMKYVGGLEADCTESDFVLATSTSKMMGLGSSEQFKDIQVFTWNPGSSHEQRSLMVMRISLITLDTSNGKNSSRETDWREVEIKSGRARKSVYFSLVKFLDGNPNPGHKRYHYMKSDHDMTRFMWST